MSVVDELRFLAERMGQDEETLLARALRLGIEVMYQQVVEQAFIEGTISREEAAAVLGEERLAEIEYAKQALAEDVARGVTL